MFLHVIAAFSEDGSNSTNDPLEYGNLHEIENRFFRKKQVIIYDEYGIAGNVNTDDEYDDDDALEGLTDYHSRKKNKEQSSDPINITNILKPFYGKEKNVVPFLLVDGTDMETQMRFLETAKPLFENTDIVTVAIENNPSLNMWVLISFFDQVNYKTFFLGSRQLARIDHLCSEILEDVVRNPSITPPNPSLIQKILFSLRFVRLKSLDWKRLDDNSIINNGTIVADTKKEYPPFFIAMPKIKHRQSMQIQHMYDLFGGYDSGGGQIKTANDRKAPGK